MFIRKTRKAYRGKAYTSYVLVESARTAKGPRQKIVCSLGSLEPAPREHWRQLAHKVHARERSAWPGEAYHHAPVVQSLAPGCRLDLDDEEVGLPIKRMKPLLDRAMEGRANPKGIPCLYLATTDQTAMAEVRPWDGSTISLALFKTVRPLRIVNCTLGLGRRRRGIRISTAPEEGPSPKEREKRVWRQIDTAFARPVSRSDDLADYVPTQIIAELFKANGFDGLACRSWLGPGHNLALFDLNAAELVQCAP